MNLVKIFRAALLSSLLLSASAWSAEAQLQIDFPRTSARPYVAIWLEKADDRAFVGSVAVWYDINKRNNRGTRWLSSLREWWRLGGDSDLAIDGIAGATPAAGRQTIELAASPLFAKLPAGNYNVVVEASREHGGHDVVRVPLQWPPKRTQQAEASGNEEVGAIRLVSKP